MPSPLEMPLGRTVGLHAKLFQLSQPGVFGPERPHKKQESKASKGSISAHETDSVIEKAHPPLVANSCVSVSSMPIGALSRPL